MPIPYTARGFPRMSPSYATLFGNLYGLMLEQVQKFPEWYIALIPYGAGHHLNQSQPSLSNDLETFLKSFGFPGSDRLHVAHTLPNITPKPGTHFAKPFPYLLLHSPEPLHHLLLWQQTFVFQLNGRRLAFNVIAPDP